MQLPRIKQLIKKAKWWRLFPSSVAIIFCLVLSMPLILWQHGFCGNTAPSAQIKLWLSVSHESNRFARKIEARGGMTLFFEIFYLHISFFCVTFLGRGWVVSERSSVRGPSWKKERKIFYYKKKEKTETEINFHVPYLFLCHSCWISDI